MSTDSVRRVPSYRLHKASGQAVITLNGRDFYLGVYRSKASRDEYNRLIAEWLANDRQTLPSAEQGLTVAELAGHFKRHAKNYYGDGTKSYLYVRQVMRFLGDSPYGSSPINQFGPLALKTLQTLMVGEGRSRDHVNRHTAVIKQAVKWGVANELLPPSMSHALGAVGGLRKGRTTAPDGKPVLPIDDATVQATLPYLSPVVADMVRLQRLCGARPDEICSMRPVDVNRSGDIWTYRPQHHKTQYLGHDRVILIGPKAQAILTPYLLRACEAYCFSPKESEARRRAEAHAKRTTPASCGNNVGTNRKRCPKLGPGDRYDTASYRRAISYACDQANAAAIEAATKAGQTIEAGTRLVARWAPNRLRHSAATEIRKRYGLEAAQVTLGHAKADTTQIYAERDLMLAMRVAKEVG